MVILSSHCVTLSTPLLGNNNWHEGPTLTYLMIIGLKQAQLGVPHSEVQVELNIGFQYWVSILGSIFVFNIGFNIGSMLGFNISLNIGLNIAFNIWLNTGLNIGSKIVFNIGFYNGFNNGCKIEFDIWVQY